MELMKYSKSNGNKEAPKATFEDMIAFYLVRPENGVDSAHEGALVVPGNTGRDGQIGTMQLEVYPALRTGRWHWKILSHETKAFMEDPYEGFESAAEAMENALETEDGRLCFTSWLDGKRLIEMARSAQAHRMRKVLRGM